MLRPPPTGPTVLCMDTLIRLDHAEDGVLRRLHWFETCGAELAPPMRRLKADLRARDLRREIRDPYERGVTSR